MTVYVLHIDPPHRHARHYVGYTPDPDPARRIDEHLNGMGSPLIKAALAAGCTVAVAYVFDGAERDFEHNLKKRKDVRQWCPLCAVGGRPMPDPARMSARFKQAKAWP